MDRWDNLNDKITVLAQNQSQLRERVDSLVVTVNSHDDIINRMNETHAMTQEIRDYLQSAKGFFRVVGWGGAVARFLWPIAAIAIGFFIFIKTGKWEKL